MLVEVTVPKKAVSLRTNQCHLNEMLAKNGVRPTQSVENGAWLTCMSTGLNVLACLACFMCSVDFCLPASLVELSKYVHFVTAIQTY